MQKLGTYVFGQLDTFLPQQHNSGFEIGKTQYRRSALIKRV